MSEDPASPGGRPNAVPEDLTPANPASALFNALQTAVTAGFSTVECIVANFSEAQSTQRPDASVAADLSPILSRVMLVAAGSSLRYWRDLATLCGKHQGSLLQAINAHAMGQGLTGQECRLAADELRAFLREVGDTASLEAQRLQLELGSLSESVAELAARDTAGPPDAKPVRRWRAKP